MCRILIFNLENKYSQAKVRQVVSQKLKGLQRRLRVWFEMVLQLFPWTITCQFFTTLVLSPVKGSNIVLSGEQMSFSLLQSHNTLSHRSHSNPILDEDFLNLQEALQLNKLVHVLGLEQST